MKVGLDLFTIHPLGLAPRAALDYLKSHDLAGGQFGRLGGISPTRDKGELKDFRATADGLGLYTHLSAPLPNPHLGDGKPIGDLVAEIEADVKLAARFGWHEMHACLGGPDERYRHAVPWDHQLADSTEVIRRAAPALRDCGSRINLETHGENTTWELVRLAEEVGPDVAGICLDTANVLCFGEDPVAAARRAAPYTHLTHAKDGIIYFSEAGYTRQGRPPGQGVLDWEQILPILHAHQPDLPLSIEDHKWLFEIPIFDPKWHHEQPDLPREELAEVVRLAWETQKRIHCGELPDPAAYEAIPYADQLERRLASGRDYLKGLVAKLP